MKKIYRKYQYVRLLVCSIWHCLVLYSCMVLLTMNNSFITGGSMPLAYLYIIIPILLLMSICNGSIFK